MYLVHVTMRKTEISINLCSVILSRVEKKKKNIRIISRTRKFHICIMDILSNPLGGLLRTSWLLDSFWYEYKFNKIIFIPIACDMNISFSDEIFLLCMFVSFLENDFRSLIRLILIHSSHIGEGFQNFSCLKYNNVPLILQFLNIKFLMFWNVCEYVDQHDFLKYGLPFNWFVCLLWVIWIYYEWNDISFSILDVINTSFLS